MIDKSGSGSDLSIFHRADDAIFSTGRNLGYLYDIPGRILTLATVSVFFKNIGNLMGFSRISDFFDEIRVRFGIR